MHSKLPDGRETCPSGPGVVHVSRFRAEDKDEAMPTNAISGPLFNASSPSADLCMSLANRLAANLEGNGCPLYKQTLSQWDMPAGPPIFRLRALARRTSGNGFSGLLDGWRTPDTSMGGAVAPEKYQEWVNRGGQVRLSTQANLSGWPTPNAIEIEGPADNPGQFSVARRTKEPGKKTSNLGRMAHLTNVQLTIPLVASDTNAGIECGVTTDADSRPDVAAEAVANSPTNAPDNPGNVLLTGWATPTVRDHKDGAASLETNRINARLVMEVRLTGETSNGSPAPTERRGQLNPEFTRWLMGYPEEWASCAPTGMR